MAKLTRRGLRFSEIVIEVFQKNGLLLQVGDALCAPLGLSSARWQVLGIVEHGPASVAQIARHMGLRRQSVRETAAALAADGLATFQPNPGHRTARLLSVTPRGAAVMRQVTRLHARWANSIAGHFSLAELDALWRGLRLLGERVETEVVPKPRAVPSTVRAPKAGAKPRSATRERR